MHVGRVAFGPTTLGDPASTNRYPVRSADGLAVRLLAAFATSGVLVAFADHIAPAEASIKISLGSFI